MNTLHTIIQQDSVPLEAFQHAATLLPTAKKLILRPQGDHYIVDAPAFFYDYCIQFIFANKEHHYTTQEFIRALEKKYPNIPNIIGTAFPPTDQIMAEREGLSSVVITNSISKAKEIQREAISNIIREYLTVGKNKITSQDDLDKELLTAEHIILFIDTALNESEQSKIQISSFIKNQILMWKEEVEKYYHAIQNNLIRIPTTRDESKRMSARQAQVNSIASFTEARSYIAEFILKNPGMTKITTTISQSPLTKVKKSASVQNSG